MSLSRYGWTRRACGPVVLSLLALTGCSDDTPSTGPDSQRPVAAIELAADSLFLGGIELTRELTAEARDEAGTVIADAVLAWTTADETVATVSGSGMVTGKGKGTTTVTATSGAATASAKITVEQVAASLLIEPGSLALDSLLAVAQLTAVVADSGGTAMAQPVDVEWYSGDSRVVIILDDGLVQARGAGEADVTAVAPDLDIEGIVRAIVRIPALAGIVNDEGGSVTAADGAVKLDFEQGALASPAAITVTPATDVPTGGSVIAGTAYTFGPSGIEFAAPVDLTLKYDPTALPAAVNEKSLGLYRLTGSEWEEVAEIAVDTTAHTVIGRLSSFSTYAIRHGRLSDPTGLWAVTETTEFDSCYDEVGLVESISVFAEKNGNVLSVERGGETVSGTLVGNVFGWDEKYAVDGVQVRETYTITINRTGLTATGAGRYVGSGPVNCEIRTSLTAERVGRTRPAATPEVASVTLKFVLTPAATSRTWRPETGDGVQLIAEARDASGVTIPGAEIGLRYSEDRVLADPPNRIAAATATTMRPGLVGKTTVTAFVLTPALKFVESEPLTIDLTRTPTVIQLLAPERGANGRFFDLDPLLAWKDGNGEAARWEVVAGNKRLPLRLRRPGYCTVDKDQCEDRVRGMWEALGATSVAFVRLEGVNELGNVVSSATYDFAVDVPARVNFHYATLTPIWVASGHGYSPSAPSPHSNYPNPRVNSCPPDRTACLDSSVKILGKRTILRVVDMPVVNADYQAATIWIPDSAFDTDGIATAPWDCTRDFGKIAIEDIAHVSFRWRNENGSIEWATGDNDSYDPTPYECAGSIAIEISEHTDLRGTWRIYSISGEGTMHTPLGIQPVKFSVEAPVKWAEGTVDPPIFFGEQW